MDINVPSLKLCAKAVLEVLEGRAILMFNQGQRLKVTDYCQLHKCIQIVPRLKLFAQTAVEILQELFSCVSSQSKVKAKG